MTELVRWQQRKNKLAKDVRERPNAEVAACFSVKALEQLNQIRDMRVKDILNGNVPSMGLVVQNGCVMAVKSNKRKKPFLVDHEHTPRDIRRVRGAR